MPIGVAGGTVSSAVPCPNVSFTWPANQTIGLRSEAPGMEFDETTCGQELAQDAEVPELLGQLWGHVATNLVTHAKWVGTATPEAAAEHDSLTHIAREYRNIAAAAERAASIMKGMHDLTPAPHDPSRQDRAGQARFIRHKIKLQLELADLLVRHAEASRSALADLELQLDD